MLELALFIVPSVAIAAYLTNVALRAPRPVAVKVLCIAGLAGLMPITAAGFSELLGRPKPVALQHPVVSSPDVTVIASTMKEGVNIWLWVVREDQAEPRAYVLPWSEQAAKQLREAESEGERDGAPVKMRQTALNSRQEEVSEQMFYVAPQVPLPPKTKDAG
jgi:hypothetical protein